MGGGEELEIFSGIIHKANLKRKKRNILHRQTQPLELIPHVVKLTTKNSYHNQI